MSTALTKLDVARRQLAVAIRLFFDDRDAISVHTLAANSWEIVDLLCKNREVDSFSKHARDNLPDGKSLKRDFINQPYRNFFKHADENPEGTVEGFSDDKNDHIPFLVVEDLVRLEQPALFECLVFQIWYLAVYEGKIATEDLEEVLPTIRDAFPNIRNFSRLEQKRLGREFLQKFSKDKQMLADPRTDMSEINRWEGRLP